MSRRTRPAALLAAAALLAGGSASLALAPAAAAADPTLGSLTYSPNPPQADQPIVVSGTGCIPGFAGVSSSAAGAAAPADAAPADASTAGTAPADGTVAPAADPALGSVVVTVKGPQGFNSTAEVETNARGAWTSNSDGDTITLGDAGDYTIDATCQVAGVPILNYGQQAFTISGTTTPPPTSSPTVNVSPSGTVAPGTSVTVSGFGFGGASNVAVTLDGYGTKNLAVDTSGGFPAVSFPISATQAGGTLAGRVVPNSGSNVATQTFSVVVASTQSGDGNVDGTVPGGDDTDTSATTTTGGSTTTGSTTTGRGYVATKPTLPNTGTDTLWPGLVGGLLLVSGAGLVWAGRRREQAGTTAV